MLSTVLKPAPPETLTGLASSWPPKATSSLVSARPAALTEVAVQPTARATSEQARAGPAKRETFRPDIDVSLTVAGEPVPMPSLGQSKPSGPVITRPLRMQISAPQHCPALPYQALSALQRESDELIEVTYSR